MSGNIDSLQVPHTRTELEPDDAEQRPRRSPAHSFEMDDSLVLDRQKSRSGTPVMSRSVSSLPVHGIARHTLGLLLLLSVVFLWTMSNFLGSSIFADKSYAKPFFLTYLNTSVLIFAMIPDLLKTVHTRLRHGTLRGTIGTAFSIRNIRYLWRGDDGLAAQGNTEAEAFIQPDSRGVSSAGPASMSASVTSIQSEKEASNRLDLRSTLRLALAFCLLWFGANYFAMACLQYTTVASTTILTSTSSAWTLLIGALTRTEKFTWRKLCGVLGSLLGIILISRVDFSSSPTEESSPETTALRSQAFDPFPEKSVGELALGDALALLSAIIYGFYTTSLKRATMTGTRSELHMPTFFGLVGILNVIVLLPLFPILHFTGVETFELPPTGQIWTVLLVNSVSSFGSDIAWAYAMVFTSPLVVTVGLSLTIPLSLVGEMIIQSRYEGWVYWVGATIVVGSFVFVEREEVKEEMAEVTEEETRNVEEGRMGGSFLDDEDHDDGDTAAIDERDTTADLMDHGSDDDDDDDDRIRDRLHGQAQGSPLD